MNGHRSNFLSGASAAALLLAFGLAAGCRTNPFTVEPRVPVAASRPDDVRASFAARLPSRFTTSGSVVFDYRWHSLAALAYATVSVPANSFTAVCLTPVGVKLFDIMGHGEDIAFRSVLPEFNQHPEFGQAVGADIRRIYLDLVPAATAEVRREKYEIVFKQPQGSGYVEYVFGGRDCLLLAKRYHEGWHLVWEIGFYEYREHEGKLYPTGVVLRNHRYGYSLTARMKEVRLLPETPAAPGP